MTGMSPAVQSAINLKDKAIARAHPRADIRERSFKMIIAMMVRPHTGNSALDGAILVVAFEVFADRLLMGERPQDSLGRPQLTDLLVIAL